MAPDGKQQRTTLEKEASLLFVLVKESMIRKLAGPAYEPAAGNVQEHDMSGHWSFSAIERKMEDQEQDYSDYAMANPKGNTWRQRFDDKLEELRTGEPGSMTNDNHGTLGVGETLRQSQDLI
jgi:hypothetical protein